MRDVAADEPHNELPSSAPLHTPSEYRNVKETTVGVDPCLGHGGNDGLPAGILLLALAASPECHALALKNVCPETREVSALFGDRAHCGMAAGASTPHP